MRLFKSIHKYYIEIFIIILSIGFGLFMLWWINDLGLVKASGDAYAHLNFSRLLFDSLTPGISQIGYWPPLLHILMAPLANIDWLYINGFAGFLILLPALSIATLVLYKISYLLTKNRLLSLTAGILFLINPYILFYTVSPMMEILFLANLFVATYFLLLWLQKENLHYLILTSMFISLASLSRFEGLILIPIIGLTVLIRLLIQRKPFKEIEALLILFIMPAIAGMLFILSYGYIFGGDFLSFAKTGWWVHHLSEELRVKYTIFSSANYLLFSAYYIFSKPIVFLSLISFIFLLLFSPDKFKRISAIIILGSPLLFVLITIDLGVRNLPILVPDLPPYSKFFNERYALLGIGAVILTPILLGNLLLEFFRNNRKLYIASWFLLSIMLLGLLSASGYYLYKVAYLDKYYVVRNNLNVVSEEQIDLAKYMKLDYDFGKILATRIDNDPFMVEAGIPLKNYIHEGNYRYNKQVLDEPWFFARWVIMFNPSNTSDPWGKDNEPVSKKWGASETFLKYYNLVLENKKKKIYKVDEKAVRKLAFEMGYDPSQLPSINPRLTWWDPQTIYSKIQTPDSSQVARKVSSPSKSETRSRLKIFYESDLKSYYKDGFYIDAQNAGNSESQSYALLQSYWAGDKETFDKVWKWTKENLQRKTDHLFSWKFNYSPDTLKVQISDKNSATDADTDIAYALLKAGEDWKNSKHIDEAKLIIRDLWEIETASASGERNIIAGSWANKKDHVILNPSYFSPFAYRVFAKYDTDHDWESLINDGYSTLSLVSGDELRKDTKIFLPPNWVVLNNKNGDISIFTDKPDSIDYSYDAFRTFWRVAMDQLLYPNSQARGYLEKASIFKSEWEKNKQFCTIYRFNEGATSCEFVTSTLTGPLAVLSVTEPSIASEVVEKYLMPSENITLPESTSFYHKSWYWFGLGLWSEYFNSLNTQKN